MKILTKRSICLLSIVVFGWICSYYSYGPSYASSGSKDRTNSPMSSYSTCSNQTGCHTSLGSFTPVTTVQLLSGSTPVTSYTSSTSYTVRITMTSTTGITSSTHYGFQIVSVQSSTYNPVNTWGTPPSSTHSVTINSRNYIEQTSALSTNVINIPWTSPNVSTGNITFYCTGNIVNYNYLETGDNCASTTLTVTPQGSGCVTPTLTPNVTNILCNGDSTGAISVGVSGGSSPFLYSWTGPNGFQATSQNISNLKAGIYNLLVTATGGCTTTTSGTVVQPATAVSVSVSSNSPLCTGSSLSINCITSGGTGTLTPSWSGPSGFTSSYLSVGIAGVTPANSGNYILTVHDANNCIVRDTAVVVVNALPAADSIHATGIDAHSYNFSGVNPQYVQQYKWDFGDGGADTAAMPSYSYAATGTYTVRLIVSNNCGADTLYKTMSPVVTPGSVYQLPGPDKLSVYPNPAHDALRIVNNTGLNIRTIRMYDIHGIKVYEHKAATNKQEMVNITNLNTGIYLLSVDTDNGSIVKTVNVIQ